HAAHVAFKHLRDESRLLDTLAKDADRRTSGKFITIYPDSEQSLHECLLALDAKIGGLPGPYVLSDLRWEQGPLFVRYGAFASQHLIQNGTAVPAIRDLNENELVPDVRDAAFHIPTWVKVPSF